MELFVAEEILRVKKKRKKKDLFFEIKLCGNKRRVRVSSFFPAAPERTAAGAPNALNVYI